MAATVQYHGGAEPALKFYRTMVRVSAVEKDYAILLIPSWNPDEMVRLARNVLPQNIEAQKTYRVDVNLEALRPEDLKFKNFHSEPEPDPDPHDGLV